MWWFVACTPGEFVPHAIGSEVAPAAFRVAWDGPAADATLWIDDGLFGGWQLARTGAVSDGESTWPLGLWPAGRTVRYRIDLDTGDGLLRSSVGTVDIPNEPDLLGRPHLAHRDDRSEAATGWVVTQRYSVIPIPSEAFAVVLNGGGDVVWWATPDDERHRAVRARPSADGRSVLVLQDHEDPALRRIERYPLDGGEVVRTAAPAASHDFWENGDGTFTYVAHDFRPDVHLVGANPTVADRLRTVTEGDEDGATMVDGFSFFDDYPIDPWFPCGHAATGFFVPGANEWTHVNSLVRAPNDDGWWMSVRHLNALVEVGDDGTFHWQAGGRDETLTARNGAAFEHAHASHAFAPNRILMFDNGDHSPAPVVSRVVELQLDPASGTWEEVWELPAPHGDFVSFLGDARRLPGGNTLVAWTDDKEIGEYTTDGDEVWRVDATERYGRATWVPELVP